MEFVRQILMKLKRAHLSHGAVCICGDVAHWRITRYDWVQIKENIKVPRHWPLCGEFPAQMASNAENVSIRWRHHE